MISGLREEHQDRSHLQTSCNLPAAKRQCSPLARLNAPELAQITIICGLEALLPRHLLLRTSSFWVVPSHESCCWVVYTWRKSICSSFLTNALPCFNRTMQPWCWSVKIAMNAPSCPLKSQKKMKKEEELKEISMDAAVLSTGLVNFQQNASFALFTRHKNNIFKVLFELYFWLVNVFWEFIAGSRANRGNNNLLAHLFKYHL